MKTNERPFRFNMTVSEEERQMLRVLAGASGLSVSDVVRMLVRDAHKAHEAEQLTKKTKKR